MKSFFVPLFILILASSPVLAADASISEAYKALNGVFAARTPDMQAFVDLTCANPTGKQAISNLLEAAEAAQATGKTLHTSYMAAVTKPMLGDGKCDGGFAAVSKESGQRGDLSKETGEKFGKLAAFFAKKAQDNFEEGGITLNLLGGRACAERALDLLDSIEQGIDEIAAGYQGVQASLAYEEKKFRDYAAVNNGLRERCGETAAGQNTVIHSAAGAGSGAAPAAVPQGSSRNPASSITGVEQDAAKRAQQPAQAPK